jgi:ASC-1-like (ASCH) protein
MHVAIVDFHAARGLIAGVKRVESRLYRSKRSPYGRIRRGETIYFKLSGGEIIGATRALRVLEFGDLTPRGVERLRRRYGRVVRAPAEYWRARRDCRYGVLIWLAPLREPLAGPPLARQYGNGWLTLGGD